MPNVSLPVLPADRPLKLSPTDVTLFVGLEQCERFLRFRLAERAGQEFMEPYDVAPQRLAPLLSLSGATFEEEVAAGLADVVDFSTLAGKAQDRPANNDEVVERIRALQPGQSAVLSQVRLVAAVGGWTLRGDVDLIRLDREGDGTLRAFIGDLKSTTEVKVEHRLQVAFYRLMLEKVLADAGIAHAPMETGILFRPPIEPDDELSPLRDAAKARLGLADALLEVIDDGESYLRSADDLVLAADSVARRVAATPFEDVPYCLSFKCDGCLYNEFCFKWSAETEDLSLLPYLTGTEKESLRRAGIDTIQSLATLKDVVPDPDGKPKELVPAPGREAQVRQVAGLWTVGPRLDELVHRAKMFRRTVRRDGSPALTYIPGKGNSTLPVSTPEQNPNLVNVYLDAQQDYLEGRVWLLGALVIANRDGKESARKVVVRMSDGPPDSDDKERGLLTEWTRDLVAAVIELAVSEEEPKEAPIHVVFFDRREQTAMLEALARNFRPIMGHTPPLYDFLTQVAAFDSPVASFLDEEMRTTRNFPMTCPSLQSVATYLKFDWGPFREAFEARMFDHVGKGVIDGAEEWYVKRSRFSSSVPLEYAYAAWGVLPAARPGGHDEFAAFRGATVDSLLAFQRRRLEAVAHVAGTLHGNKYTTRTPFTLPDLARFEDKAADLAHALHEFVTIERHVDLHDWKTTRHAPPERRVLMGDCLLVRYVEADQDPGVAEQNRENERRRLLKEQYKAAQADPSKRLPKEQAEACKWSLEGMRLRLRVETTGVDCDLHEALLMSNVKPDERMVLYPRWTVDERKPKDEQGEFTPTPKQMLYGQRATLVALHTTADAAGRIVSAVAEVELQEGRGNANTQPHVFGAFSRPPHEGRLYTLDPCADDWYGAYQANVVDGLCEGKSIPLYDRLVTPPDPGDGKGSPGQAAFLAGLDAFHAAGKLHDFEAGKRELIGGHGSTPLLLVQGPPGTGKSYSTAFAVFARLQGAMRDKKPCRAFLTCKTHAATDVLLKNLVKVRDELRKLRDADPTLFAKHFDARLLDVPLIRFDPRDRLPDDVRLLRKKDQREEGDPDAVAAILEPEWAVVAITPGGTYRMLKDKWSKELFGHGLCDLLVLDEASQMNLPEALMAALPLKAAAPVVVVGDHRQMPPIVKHDWATEARRTFGEYAAYESLFDTLRAKKPPMIRFAESFRLHSAMAEFLRREVYRHDGIEYHSRKKEVLAAHPAPDDFVDAVLKSEHPLVVVIHDEAGSQVRNPYEQSLIDPVLRALADPATHGLDPVHGLGIVVPHRAQRAALQQAFPQLSVLDQASGLPTKSAIDTVERFQGDERTVILVSATESDRAYLLASSAFLLDPRRLTVAVSRAKEKMILVASKGIFSLFSPDEETFANVRLWKNLLHACPSRLWDGERSGRRVTVWGGNPAAEGSAEPEA